MTPRVLATHADLVAVDKPSGWVVHPVGTDAPDVLAWAVEQGLSEHLAPVHRLDRGTSGVVLLGEPAGIESLNRCFREGTVTKRYLALVFGKTRDKGVIRRAFKEGEAVSRYRTVESFSRWSLVEVRPETGRKHQIRRHLQGIGHALIGDDRYRPRGRPTVPAFPGRLWLHAASLELPDGRRFEAPLPDALAMHLERLRVSAG